MNWYSAKLVYQIQIESMHVAHQFDESIRLIKAESMEAAFQQATKIGFENQSRFKNMDGHWVMWSFINVDTLMEIGDIHNGVEVFTLTEEMKNPEHYIRLVNNKSQLYQDLIHTEEIRFE